MSGIQVSKQQIQVCKTQVPKKRENQVSGAQVSKKVEIFHQWNSPFRKKAGKSSERDLLPHKVEKSDYWVPRSQKRKNTVSGTCARKLQIYPVNGTHV